MSNENAYDRRKRRRKYKKAANLDLLEENAIALAQLGELDDEPFSFQAEEFDLEYSGDSHASASSGDERDEFLQESNGSRRILKYSDGIAQAIDLSLENSLDTPLQDNKADKRVHLNINNMDLDDEDQTDTFSNTREQLELSQINNNVNPGAEPSTPEKCVSLLNKTNEGRMNFFDNDENDGQTATVLSCQSFDKDFGRNEADHDNTSSSDEDLPEDLGAFKEMCSSPQDKLDSVQNVKLTLSDVSPEVWKIITREKQEETLEEKFKTNLTLWAGHHRIKRNALDELLHLLRQHGHSDLPACSKTLLKTPRCTADFIKTVAGGQFWYRGIQNGLQACLTNVDIESLKADTVVLDIFLDGISPHKSVRRHLWPIAGCLKGHQTPFIIALWCGSSHEPTSVDEYFEDYLIEAAYIFENGFIFQNKTYKLTIRRYHADAPARAWLKKVKKHNSYHACERCTVAGEWKFRRITYDPAVEGTLRTDESFEKQTHQEHHEGISPLLRLGTKMITQVPLDPMHLVYLGVTKRLFGLLLQTKKGKFKLSDIEVSKLDSLCIMLSDYCPSDFARKIRPLSHHKLFKATEFRRMLLYDGFVINKKHRFKEVCECYLLLACAMRILLDVSLRSQFSADAHELLVRFVKQSYYVLGSSFVVFNVHNLLHFVADCNIHGDPDDFSCFKFENNLGHLKDYLAAPGRTMQQIICRLIERSLLPPASTSTSSAQKELFKPHIGPTLDLRGKQYASMKCVGSVIHVVARGKPRDSCVIMSSGRIVVVENILEESSGIVFIIGREFLNTSDYFKFPVPSSLLKIFKVCQLGDLSKWRKEDIARKAVYFPINVEESDYETFDWRDGEGLCMPLLHSEV